GTHYGYYADVTKADGYAAYYLGRVSIGTATTNNYLLPLSRGSNGQIMQINGNQVSFIDPATIGDGIGTDNQTIDKLNLNGTTLEISLLNDGVIDETVDLSSLQDGTGTDNQTINKLNLNGTTLEISLLNDGVVDETVDLSSLQDGIGATKIDELTDGKSDVSGSSIFLGINAGLVDNGSNNDNIGIGLNALKTSTTGEGNVAIGSQSLEANINSRYNIAIGTRALSTTTISGQNLAIGYESLEVSTGDSNVAVGHQALNANVAGANNVAIGHKAGLLNVGANNIFIGKGAGSQELTANHKLYIENSDSTYPLIYGDFSAGSVGINWNSTIALTNILSVNGSNVSKSTAGSWLANSDRRLKNEITTINTKTALDKISKMRGVTYKWNDDKTGLDRPTEIQYGFIAQELMEVFPTKVTKDKLGYYQTAYGDYDPLFVQAIKELQNIIHKQETKIEALEATLNTKESAFNILNKRLEKIEVLLINKKNNH
ncbi:tail fiber domain-containing protein, partial [Psychroserpens sp.]